MDTSYKFPGSPGTPLYAVSPERVNQQRPQYDPESPTASLKGESGHSRESSVHDKVAAFNTLAYQSKQLERKTNDAALKRAMLGREEAESEARRYRDDVRALRRQVEEGKERERKVGERLENVMENYGRAKETHAHTQTLWEKEIRRVRKESFKSQSVVVKLQEELKSARNAAKVAQADLEQEKARSAKREEEAFAARYQLVGAHEELAQMEEKIKLVEQERDALKTIAKNEEIARIAAEGRLPLPASLENDEFASPKKVRKSFGPVDILSSAAGEDELDHLRRRLEWEEQKASRALDHVEFLESECRFHCCASRAPQNAEPQRPVTSEGQTSQIGSLGTLVTAAEGFFRPISPAPEESPWISPAKKTFSAPIFPEPTLPERSFARTPSCDPPASALISDVNTSLLSLLDAPHSPSSPTRTDDGNTTIIQTFASSPTRSDDENTTMVKTFHTISTTTRIPLANPPDLTPQPALPIDLSNPVFSPTMSREEALAQIRERRGRARSLAQGTLTPRKQMVEGGARRDISAPAIKSGNVRGRSQARV